MTIVKPDLMDKVKKLGAFDVTACYSCGTCTAICPLSLTNHEFPRRLIRYTLLGLEDKVLASPEIWLCYYCGECTKSCPRDADPGGFMMALRRYVTQKYSLLGIGRLFYGNRIISLLSWLILSLIAFIGIYLFIGLKPPVEYEYIKYLGISTIVFSDKALDFLHNAGLALGIIVLVSALANLFIMYKHIKKGLSPDRSIGLGVLAKNFFNMLIKEVAIQERYWECENKFRYYAHLSLLWGFVGLFIATLIGFGIDFYNLQVSRLWPLLLGIIFGLILMYGSGYFLYKRILKDEEFSEYSDEMDWVFTGIIFLVGLSGFFVTVFRFMSLPELWYGAFIIHLILVFDLIITAPFTKFMHALYRPLALLLVDSEREVKEKEEEAVEIPA